MCKLNLWLLTPSIILNSAICAAQINDLDEQYFNQNQEISSNPLLHSLKSTKISAYQLPTIKDLAIDPDVRTLFVETDHLPIVDIQLTFNAGSARDESIEPKLFGIANTTARLFNNGHTSSNNSLHLQSLKRLGAQYSVQAYRDMFVIKLRVLSEPHIIQHALYHLTSMLKPADFPQNNIDNLWKASQVGQRQIIQNPTSSMSIRFYREIYDKHAYAEPITGTNQSLKQIKTKHLKAFQQKYLVKQNLNLAITGKISETQAKDIAQTVLLHLNKGEKAQPIADVTPSTQAKFIHIPFNSEQAYVLIGGLNVARSHPDRIALELGNHILGGSGFNSLLMKALREKNGYAYSASSQMTSLQAQGVFSMSYSTQRQNLYSSLKVAYMTLFDFTNKPLDLVQLENTKQSIIRSFPKQFSGNANINAQIALIGFYGLPTDYLQVYLSRIDHITDEDIQTAWQKHIQPKNLVTIVAGEKINLDEIKSIKNIVLKEINELKDQSKETY